MSEVKVGESYRCKPIGLKHEVIGFIEHTYTNTVLISVEEYDPRDRAAIIEYQNRLLVKYCDVHTLDHILVS